VSNDQARKRKEQDKIDLPALPKSAADCKSWLRTVYGAVSIAAFDPTIANSWIWRLREPDIKYEDLRSPESEPTLDEKLRHAITRQMGTEAGKKVPALVSEIEQAIDTEFTQVPPTQPSGRQLLHVIKTFYEVKAERRDWFEMRHLHELVYWGDNFLTEWKRHWNNLVRNQRIPPDDKVLEEIYIAMCRQSAAKLSKIVDMYDFSCEGDSQRSYTWLEKMTEKIIKEARGRVNLESLAAGHEAAIKAKKPAMPGTTPDPGGGAPATPGTTPQNPNAKKQGGKGDKGKKGAGKGDKGKGKDSGKSATGASPGGGNSPARIPDPNRSCILNLFGKCKLGAVLGKGVTCEKGIHRKKPLDSDRTHPFFKKLEKEHGAWEPNKFKYPDGSVAVPVVQGGDARTRNACNTPAGSPTGATAQPQGGAKQ